MASLLFDNTISTGNYSNFLTQFTALLGENQRDCWFPQDRANAHTVKTTKAFLQSIVSNCIVRQSLVTTIPKPYTTWLLSQRIS